MTVSLTKSPFNLSQEQVIWVLESLKKMSVEEKIGQLFMTAAADSKDKTLDSLLSIKPGGVMLRPLKEKDVLKTYTYLSEHSNLPLFFSANLETGSNGIVEEGTNIGHELLIAATDDVDNAYEFGKACMSEAKQVGGNMAFAPIIDLSFNWENPIVNIRSFGDDVERVSQMSQAYVRGVQEQGGAVTIKHFPGDGVDGRDHHIVKSVNALSYEDWKRTYGKVYQDNINSGATGVMVGHITFPGYFANQGLDEAYKNTPASLNPYLIQKLLRKELGFNGLVITDASLMTGFGGEGKRRDLVPQAIASGNDMFLFTKNMKEDFGFMLDGYEQGIITDERLNEAVTRILGLKAKMNLHLKQAPIPGLGDLSTSKKLAKKVADEGITLVRDDQKLLPLSSSKTKKIGIISLGNDLDIFEELAKSAKGIMKLVLKLQKKNRKTFEVFGDILSGEGFEVCYIDHSKLSVMMEAASESIETFTSKYDAIVYFVKKDTMSNQTNVRVAFKSFAGFDAPWFIHEIPTLLISVASPYHQYDFPDVRTVINAYSPTEEVLKSLVAKLTGQSEFKGHSPVLLDFNPVTKDLSRWDNLM